MGLWNALMGRDADGEKIKRVANDDEELFDSAPGTSVEELAALQVAIQEQRKDLKQARDISNGINWDDEGGDDTQWKGHIKKGK